MANGLENLILPPFVALAIGAAMGASAWLMPAADLPQGVRYGVVGALFVLSGLFGAPAIAAFARAGTTINPVRIANASALVTGGIYSVSRNPMYVGLTGLLLALAVALARPGCCSARCSSSCSSPASRSSPKSARCRPSSVRPLPPIVAGSAGGCAGISSDLYAFRRTWAVSPTASSTRCGHQPGRVLLHEQAARDDRVGVSRPAEGLLRITAQYFFCRHMMQRALFRSLVTRHCQRCLSSNKAIIALQC